MNPAMKMINEYYEYCMRKSNKYKIVYNHVPRTALTRNNKVGRHSLGGLHITAVEWPIFPLLAYYGR